ncbi:hypothetical protein NQ318_004869 [Aromia moschata]|uniref:Uncharacterized protein n=1 Tax=Aromia moschata TaxID=1265417 RepID=A0AAV8Z175_9CUCU|nr:hypothetical protein NQ318_004869 [Aromia moschata]
MISSNKVSAMAFHPEMTTILRGYEKLVVLDTFTKADFRYHSTKQSLHNMWAKMYDLEGSEERSASIRKINECLVNLERRVDENEKRKYLNYYSRRHRAVGRGDKSVQEGRSM